MQMTASAAADITHTKRSLVYVCSSREKSKAKRNTNHAGLLDSVQSFFCTNVHIDILKEDDHVDRISV